MPILFHVRNNCNTHSFNDFITYIFCYNQLLLFLDDFSQVKLQTLEGIPESDYINASFIDVS